METSRWGLRFEYSNWLIFSNILYADPSKRVFASDSVKHLGHVVTTNGVSVDSNKVPAIMHWDTPNNVKDSQQFFGLTGYHRRFIDQYADTVLPPSDLLKKEIKWHWSEDQEQCFKTLTFALQQAPVLRVPDIDLEFVVHTEASNYCVGE